MYLDAYDQGVQALKGGIAATWGQTYDVYRLGPATNNAIVSGTPLITGYNARRDDVKKSSVVENSTFQLQVYEFLCDASALNIGDVLVENGYESDGGMYVLAQRRPTRENMFVRVEHNVSITRPATVGGGFANQPTSGSIVASTRVGTTKAGEEVLTLTGGVYSFQASGTFAAVPFGLQPMNRVRSEHKPEFPTQVAETQFFGYLPFLPGTQILENDIINSDSRYVIGQVYQSDGVGLQGYILQLFREDV